METEMALSWLGNLGRSVFGSMDGLFYTLVAFVVIDYITGVCVAIHNKRLSSDVGTLVLKQDGTLWTWNSAGEGDVSQIMDGIGF